MRLVAFATVPGTPRKIITGTDSSEPPPAITFKKPVAIPVINNNPNSHIEASNAAGNGVVLASKPKSIFWHSVVKTQSKILL